MKKQKESQNQSPGQEEQRRKKGGRSVQELMGVRGFTRYGLDTVYGELLFFQIAPINISVLSHDNIEIKINALQTALTVMPDLEIICTDSCECFDANKAYLRQRERTEGNAAVRRLLHQDAQMLTELQAEMSTARQFVFVRRCSGLKQEQVLTVMNDTHKKLSDSGFEVLRMWKPEIKRFLAIYFGASMNGDLMPDVDGEQYIKKKDHVEGGRKA